MATCPRFVISENMYGSIDLTECVDFKFHLFLFKSDYPFKQTTRKQEAGVQS